MLLRPPHLGDDYAVLYQRYNTTAAITKSCTAYRNVRLCNYVIVSALVQYTPPPQKEIESAFLGSSMGLFFGKLIFHQIQTSF